MAAMVVVGPWGWQGTGPQGQSLEISDPNTATTNINFVKDGEMFGRISKHDHLPGESYPLGFFPGSQMLGPNGGKQGLVNLI